VPNVYERLRNLERAVKTLVFQRDHPGQDREPDPVVRVRDVDISEGGATPEEEAILLAAEATEEKARADRAEVAKAQRLRREQAEAQARELEAQAERTRAEARASETSDA
jgi:hypothetical protein